MSEPDTRNAAANTAAFFVGLCILPVAYLAMPVAFSVAFAAVVAFCPVAVAVSLSTYEEV